jgi:glucokinase
MNTYIAADIGGTQLRVAVYPESGSKPQQEKRIPTKGQGSAVERLVGLIRELWPPGDTVLAISAGAPGQVDHKAGVVISAPNIPGWGHLNLRKALEDQFFVPAFINNDANLAALGEWQYGAGRGYHDLIYITISTGIGGGVILNDQLLLGAHGLATEIGHVIINPDGPLCGCGKRGHLEAFASGTGIAAYVRTQLDEGRPSSLKRDAAPTAREIADAAKAGDSLAMEAYLRAAEYMGMGLANYLHLFNPSIIVIGGGVSRSGSFFWDAIRTAMQKYALLEDYYKDLLLVPAALGDNCGLLGALAMARAEVPLPNTSPPT